MPFRSWSGSRDGGTPQGVITRRAAGPARKQGAMASRAEEVKARQRQIGNRATARLLRVASGPEVEAGAAPIRKPVLSSKRVAIPQGQFGTSQRRGSDDEVPGVQRMGDPPFRKDLTLQTNYVTLRISHNKGSVQEADVKDYSVESINAKDKSRPPVLVEGQASKTQGQHKVAWGAIWKALSRLEKKPLSTASMILDQIIEFSEVTIGDEEPKLEVVMGLASPEDADALITKSHNYLVGRQQDDPSWTAEGSTAEKRAQLSGKREVALGGALATWQSFSAKTHPMDVEEFFERSNIGLLFDTTGREEEELEDVITRARRELQIHNPDAFKKFKKVINKWLIQRS